MEIKQKWRLNNNRWVKPKIKKNKTYLEMNEDGNTTYQNTGAAKQL